MRRLLLPLVLLAGLTACPEKPQTQGENGPGAQGGPGGAGDKGPPPGGGGAGGPPTGEDWGALGDDEKVMLTGTVTYEGTKTGSYRVDFLTVADDAPPNLLNAATLDGAGDFSMPARKGLNAEYETVYMVAFIDVDSDGPSPTDPAAYAELSVGDVDVTDIALVLSDTPDLGPLTPGANPPNGEKGDKPAPGEGDAPEAGGPPPGEGAEGAPPPGEGGPPPGEGGPPPGEGGPPPADAPTEAPE